MFKIDGTHKFVFQKSEITEQLIAEIKKKIGNNYSGQLEKLHHLSNCEEISTELIANLKNTEIFKKYSKRIKLHKIKINKVDVFIIKLPNIKDTG